MLVKVKWVGTFAEGLEGGGILVLGGGLMLSKEGIVDERIEKVDNYDLSSSNWS